MDFESSAPACVPESRAIKVHMHMGQELFPSPSDFPKGKKNKDFKEGVRGLPHTEESKEEENRLKGIEGEFVKFWRADDIPADEFTDTAQPREDGEYLNIFMGAMEALKEGFRRLPQPIQKELLEDMQRKMKRNFFKTKEEMREHMQHLVEMNLEKAGNVEDQPNKVVEQSQFIPAPKSGNRRKK